MPAKLGFKKPLLTLLLLTTLVFPLLSPPRIFACEAYDCFSTSYDITFRFDDSGRAKVTQVVQFKNKTEDNRLQNYGIMIGSIRISDVSMTDRTGALNVKVSHPTETTTEISADTKEIVVGLGKTAEVTITYSIDDLASKHGLIWEINLPKIATPEQIDNYNLHLLVPKSFGPLHSIAPTPTNSSGADIITYNFDKTNRDANVSALFGSTQQFKFAFKYRLKNSNLLSAIGTIALPPDTDQQQIIISKMSPQPQKVYRDTDGNYLADYVIGGRKTLEIDVSGFAALSDQTEVLQTIEPTSEATLKKYLVADKYWEVENSTIQKKAKELKTAKNIYNYVTNLLKYNYKRLEQATPDRFGAVRALQEPTNAICTDYTDLFVALARAAGIPARELEGYAYTDNANTRPTKVGGLSAANILHAWPQYYDKEQKRWIAVDPTWGSTTGGVNYFDKLDTNHIVFAIHGLSSQTPIPAGGYKITGSESDDLKVDFAAEPVQKEPVLETTFHFENVIGGLPSSARVSIKNTSGQSILRPTFKFEIPGAQINSISNTTQAAFLPFETKTFDIKLTSGSLVNTRKQNVLASVKGFIGKKETKQEFNQTVLVKPFFLTINPVSVLTVLGILFLILIYPPIFNKIRSRLKLFPSPTQ